ncbi:hypothetical protein Turpa_2433 [Turneriella parva DSM 21527]|uniref:Uncharacterized protein n=1 Tax=Turneriella parva (strain ATCC BAA-1111 / DSM 21527 / NCTC 11395 / H) TaxID=869212 RepID=I4B718_TURPD|nr:hypothetical protein Turpa_2433 [Turneriella parva DSM 21527]
MKPNGENIQRQSIRFDIEVLSIDICIGVLGAGALAQAVF